MLTKNQIEDFINKKDPALFGKMLAERHLEMIQDAVREWAKDERKKEKREKKKRAKKK